MIVCSNKECSYKRTVATDGGLGDATHGGDGQAPSAPAATPLPALSSSPPPA
jgi:hypothetical protein